MKNVILLFKSQGNVPNHKKRKRKFQKEFFIYTTFIIPSTSIKNNAWKLRFADNSWNVQYEQQMFKPRVFDRGRGFMVLKFKDLSSKLQQSIPRKYLRICVNILQMELNCWKFIWYFTESLEHWKKFLLCICPL